MKIIKVLLIQNYIAHYNIPVYDLIGKNNLIDLTVIYFWGKPLQETYSFKKMSLGCRKVGPIYFVDNLFNTCSQFDVVIAMGDIHFLSLMMLGRKRRNFKLIYWGIGVSASYKNRLDQNTKWDFLRFYFMKGADAQIFYSSYPINKYVDHGFRREGLFVANNTVSIKRTITTKKKLESILFIGTLYREKGIYELLFAYKSAIAININIPNLFIIGDGQEFQNIQSWIVDNNLEEKIRLCGAIYDDSELEIYFHSAIATISPDQAGLSVLKSMGYGVPFITSCNSITGGEIFNIVNGETGVLYNSHSELVIILSEMNSHLDEYRIMGEKAAGFYNENRQPEQMAEGFISAINFVNSKDKSDE
jgi:glycosyltransferase involved in cell wall biosynthesis